MNKFIALLFAMSVSLQTFSQGMKFEEGTWAQVQDKAKKENKFIFVDCFTTWCGPCKHMSKNIFPTKEAGDFYNDKFICYKYDMEKGEGVDFATKYAIKAYPTYMFFDAQGSPVHCSGGSKPVEAFITDGKNALNPDKQVYSLEKGYKEGNRSPEFLRNYCVAMADAFKYNEPAVVDYIKYLTDEKKLFTKENFELITTLGDYGTPGFYTIVRANAEWAKVAEKKVVDDFIKYSYQGAAYSAGAGEAAQAQTKFDALVNEVGTMGLENAELLTSYMRINYFSAAKKKDEKFKEMNLFFEKFPKELDAESLNAWSWEVFENETDKEKLEKACLWAAKSVEINAEYANADTYANLLNKCGKFKEAKVWAEKAIAFAKTEKQDSSETEKLLVEIKKSLGVK